MLLDAAGQPIDMRALREPQTAQVARLRGEYELHPARGLTPARLARVLDDAERGSLLDQLDLADDMEERDAHLYAEMSKRRGAVAALEWTLEEPARADATEKSWTAMLREWLTDVEAESGGVVGGMRVLLRHMCDAMLKGYSAQELVWSLRERVLLPRATLQPQRWFTLTPDRRRFLLRSSKTTTTPGLGAVSGEELRPFSWLFHVHPARSGYPARMALARVLFWPYILKNYSATDLAEFLEIYGLPLRLGKYPAGASDPEKRALLAAVTQIGHNAAGIIPASMALEFQHAASSGTGEPFLALMTYMDAAESKAILGQTLSASEGQHGTQALGRVHEEVRMDIREDDARLVEETLYRQLIQPIGLVNIPHCNPKRLPRLRLNTGEAEDMAAYAQHLPALAAAGLQIPVQWVQDRLRIPQPQGGEPVLGAARAQPGADGFDDSHEMPQRSATNVQSDAADSQPGAAPAPDQRAALTGRTDEVDGRAPRDAIDDLVDEALADWRHLLDPLIGPLLGEIRKGVAAGESLAAFGARLPELVEQMDSRPLGAQLARAAFLARLAGEADLDLDEQEPSS